MLTTAIDIMTKRIAAILAENAPSILLYGSVPLDDFRPGWSDIDLMVLTRQAISPAQAAELVTLRQTLAAEHPENPFFRCFEGGMLCLEGFLSGQEDTVVYWGTSGQRVDTRYRCDSFSMLELCQHSRLLWGEDIRPQLPAPSREDLVAGVAAHLATIRRHAQKTSASLYSFGWLLDIARCLYTLRTGSIAAKTQAGQWALEQHLCPIPDALKTALSARQDPAAALDDPQLMALAGSLGPDIQRFADVLEAELRRNMIDLSSAAHGGF